MGNFRKQKSDLFLLCILFPSSLLYPVPILFLFFGVLSECSFLPVSDLRTLKVGDNFNAFSLKTGFHLVSLIKPREINFEIKFSLPNVTATCKKLSFFDNILQKNCIFHILV